MDQNFDIQAYMTGGVERIVADALRATVKNPRESAYMLKFAGRMLILIGFTRSVAITLVFLHLGMFSDFLGYGRRILVHHFSNGGERITVV